MGDEMNIWGWSVSGLCITTRPENMTGVEYRLNLLPNTEVHARDPKSGKLIAVQECATVKDHRNGLREIQALPDVIYAELVMHYQEPEDPQPAKSTGGAR
jgi:nitrate reductase NapAB chaperone NapD